MTNMSNFCGSGDINKIYVVDGGSGTDYFVTGGTYSNGVLTLNLQNGSVIITGFTSIDTFVTGFTYDNYTITLSQNQGQPDLTVVLPPFITGYTDTFATGFTYDNANNLTISQNQGQPDLTVNISVMTGLTVNGSVSATTYYGDGSNLTGLITTDYYVTGGTYSNGILTLDRQNGSVSITGFLSADTFVTGFTFNVGNYDLTILQNNGLPPLVQNLGILAGDITVTGGTYNPSNGVATFYNNAGGSFQVSGFLTGFTDIYLNSGTFNSNNGNLTLTRTDNVNVVITGFTDYFVTGGTYSNGTLTLNRQNGSFTVFGFLTGTTNDTFVTGFTFSSNTLTISQNQGQPPLTANITTIDLSNVLSAVTFNIGTTGSISATTINGRYLGTSGSCFTDLFVSNINSCSPLYIQPTNVGNVLIGSGGGVNVGIGVNSPTSKLHIVGIDSSSSNFGLKVQSSGGTNNLSVRNDGKVNIGTNTVYGEAKLMIKTDDTTSLLKLETSSYPYTAGEINFNGIGVALGGGSSYNITGSNYARGLALGFLASTNTEEAGMAVGHYSSANSIFRDAIAIGVSAKADGAYATAIGNLVSATTQSIMIGLGLPFNGGNLITNNVSNSIAFGLNSDTPTMWVTGGNNTPGSNGNVGINSKNPQAKLEIKGFDASSSNFGLKVQSSGGTNNLSVKNNGLVEGGGPGSLTSVASNYFQLGAATPYIEGDVTVGRLNRDSNTTFTIYGANYPQLKFDSAYSTKITLTSGLGGGYLILESNSTANNTLLSPNFVGVNLTGETINSALEVNGKTSTTTLQVTSGATAGYVLTALDSNGNASWQPATGGGGTLSGDTYVTGGTYSNGTLILERQNGSVAITGFNQYFISGSTPTGVTINYGDRWYNTNNGIELVYITDGTSDQWVQPLNTPGPPGYSNLMVTSSITTSAATLNININYYGVVHTGNVDISLPNPSGYDGYNINIKDESGNASIYRIRLTPLSGLIDGNNYVDMNTNYMSLHIVARNNNWWII